MNVEALHSSASVQELAEGRCCCQKEMPHGGRQLGQYIRINCSQNFNFAFRQNYYNSIKYDSSKRMHLSREQDCDTMQRKKLKFYIGEI